ncbi:MAG TPA: hypothetical protein VLH80_07355 [Nitrospiraceae bacterium]|nr:hypothetical protein [Nitrospiraceae bacterium]
MPWMPLVAVAIPAFMEEWREDDCALLRADDDGMAQPYIRLSGISESRMLSWAELRALRKEVEERGLSCWLPALERGLSASP